jgi:hypothetical protein
MISPRDVSPERRDSTRQHSSISRSVSDMERTQTSSGTTIDSNSTSPATPNEKPFWDVINSQGSNRRSSQFQGSIAATPQAATTGPAIYPTPNTDEEQKAWASREAQRFQKGIQNLNNCRTICLNKISSIEGQIEGVSNDENDLRQQKDKEIARVLREIEERYKKECELLQDKQDALNKSKEEELETLKRNTLEITRKETGFKRYQAIVDFYDGAEDGY